MAKCKFNGIELPVLPDYDATVYSDLYIVHLGNNVYSLILLPDGWSYGYNVTDGEYIQASGVIGTYYTASSESAAWHSESTADNPVIYSEALTPVWANFDILNEDGSVLLAASNPVPVLEDKRDLRSFVLGIVLALIQKALSPIRKKPTAYLYNGVKLPALPEWDREMFPYAVLVDELLIGYRLFITAALGYEDAAGGRSLYVTDHKVLWVGEDNTWQASVDKYADKFGIGTLEGIIWSNTDILNEDGSVFLAATEPIPVYE